MDQLCALIAGLSFGLCTPPTATPYFVDISADALPAKIGSPNAMGASAADLDSDGDLDLAIAIEYGRNRLFINDGRASLQPTLACRRHNCLASEDQMP